MAKKILAGPNLVVNPNDRDKIIQHPSVDIILQPSQWTSDVYASLAPSISQKIRVWPAGVAISPLSQSLKTIDFLVYNKIGNNPLFLGILRALQEKNYNCEVFNYGHFKQAEYFHALEHSKAVIYLSESESQGLAMLEAWARGVPAFVWERGFWKNGGYIYEGNTASPYADPENGMRFKDLADFSKLLSEFVQAVFHPRKFVEKNFSDKAAAQKYLDIVNELKD